MTYRAYPKAEENGCCIDLSLQESMIIVLYKYRFWQDKSHPIELTTNEMIEQRMNYIHENPVRAGIVAKAEDYLYSSARNYAGLSSVIEIDLI